MIYRDKNSWCLQALWAIYKAFKYLNVVSNFVLFFAVTNNLWLIPDFYDDSILFGMFYVKLIIYNLTDKYLTFSFKYLADPFLRSWNMLKSLAHRKLLLNVSIN